MSKQLAIIIPAYKDTFLRAALDSIATQTCQDFTLYIGDDCSPYDIGGIVAEYKNKIDLVYQRFETNLGGRDLVSQWERCIAMSKDEPYLWLFSDDDVMEPRCVEEFYKVLNKKSDFYHFNIKIIDAAGRVIRIPTEFPLFIDTKSFVDLHLFGSLSNAVVEFIFSRKIFQEANGFQNFDLAWGSDFITWVKFSTLNKGITTIPHNYVYWRLSDENISTNETHTIVIRKFKALIENYVVLKGLFSRNGYNYSVKYDSIVFRQILKNRKLISRREGCEFCDLFKGKQNLSFLLSVVFKIIWNILKVLAI